MSFTGGPFAGGPVVRRSRVFFQPDSKPMVFYGSPITRVCLLQYEKPREIVEMERQIQAELANLRDCNEDGLVDCNQS